MRVRFPKDIRLLTSTLCHCANQKGQFRAKMLSERNCFKSIVLPLPATLHSSPSSDT